jgi:hypothetical protein
MVAKKLSGAIVVTGLLVAASFAGAPVASAQVAGHVVHATSTRAAKGGMTPAWTQGRPGEA